MRSILAIKDIASSGNLSVGADNNRNRTMRVTRHAFCGINQVAHIHMDMFNEAQDRIFFEAEGLTLLDIATNTHGT